MQDPPETSELQAFVAVVDCGSVTRASEELGLPRATVSRRLARLEERLGVRLLHRTTRQSSLTDAGAELHRHARGILASVQDAERAIRRDDDVPRGLLRIAMPPSTGGPEFGALIVDFAARYPEVRLEVEWSTRHVDLVAEGVDVALRATSALDPGLIARRLFRSCTGAWASPAYLERAGTPATADELADHACLVGYARGERPLTHWPLVGGGSVRVHGRLATNALEVLRTSCLDGQGIAMLPGFFVGDAIRSGRLVAVLPGVVGASSEIALVYPEREFLPAAVRAFVDFVAERASSPGFLPDDLAADAEFSRSADGAAEITPRGARAR